MSVERITLEPIGDLDVLGRRWRALETESDGGFFRSWAFLGCDADRRFAGASLISVTQDGVDLALGLLGEGGGRFWLNETGVPAMDAVFVEHNGLLVRRGGQDPTGAALRHILRSRPIVMSGVDDATLLAAQEVGWLAVQQSRFAPCVSLHALTTPYLETLSANARAQVRRSRRAYGPNLRLSRAETVPQALCWFDEMVQLHQTSWIRRGKPGAFASQEMREFHTALIARAWDLEAVDLLRVDADGQLVGILYVFASDGRILSYQSGFAYNLDRAREKPGLVCHTLAIEHYIARGARFYDLLAGADRYKLTLANGGEVLHWARLHRRFSPRGAAAVLTAKARAWLGRAAPRA